MQAKWNFWTFLLSYNGLIWHAPRSIKINYTISPKESKKLFHLGLANLNFHWLVASTSLEIKLDFFTSRISRIALKSFKIPIKIQILTVFGWNRKNPAMKTLRCKIQFFGPKKKIKQKMEPTLKWKNFFFGRNRNIRPVHILTKNKQKNEFISFSALMKLWL